LAAKGEYEAPPRGWNVLLLIIQLIIPRLIFLTAIIGFYHILIHDFGLRSTISTWFSKPGWEWKLPVALTTGVFINLIVTVVRLRSRRLREAALKNLEDSHVILILTGAQALQALLPLMFAFLVIPMLGLPNNVLELFERFTLVLVIIFVGIDTLRTLRLVEAKIAHRAKIKYGGEERQIRAAETQYSVMHRMLNVLVILATLGAALMVLIQSVHLVPASSLVCSLRSPNRLLSATDVGDGRAPSYFVAVERVLIRPGLLDGLSKGLPPLLLFRSQPNPVLTFIYLHERVRNEGGIDAFGTES
jgi:hypothetical protein